MRNVGVVGLSRLLRVTRVTCFERLLAARRVALVVVVVACAVAIAACKSAPPPPPPTIVHIDVNAIDKVNPDQSGRPSPVLVRVYELKATSAFDSADFFTLYGKDQATLGADLNAKNEFLLRPGEKQSVEQPVQPGTKFIAVVAAYRDIERARWRATAPVPPNQTTIMSVRIDTADVSIAAQAAPAAAGKKKK